MAKGKTAASSALTAALLFLAPQVFGQVREYLSSPAGQAEPASARAALEEIAKRTEELHTAPPARYCGTGLAQYYFDHRDAMGPGARAAVGSSWPALIARPVLDSVYDVPGVPVRIHYNIAGPDSVRNATTDTAADGVPTYVHVAGESLTRTWNLLIDSMGFASPVGDSSAGGGLNLYDCYLARPAGQIFVIAFTASESVLIRPVTGVRYATSFQVVHPTMEPFPQLANRLDLLRITCAHELFHAIHFNLDVDEKPIWQDNGWWLEGSAVWLEDRAYPDINDWSNLPAYMNEPERSITSSELAADLHPYGGGSLWSFYLFERFGGDGIIRAIWERCGLIAGDNTLSAMSAELSFRSGPSLDGAWREYAGWCMRTGSHWDDSSFQQGADWPEPVPLRTFSRYPSLIHLTDGQDSLRTLVDTTLPDSTFASSAVSLGGLGFLPVAYVPFPTTSGSMSFFAAGLVSQPVSFFYAGLDRAAFPPAEREVDFPSRSATAIPEWLGFREMSMIAVAGAHFDSGTWVSMVTPVLIAALDTNAAASGLITMVPPHPNPVRTDQGQAAHFELTLTSPEDVHLDVFTASGERVRSITFESAIGGLSLFWDGTNDAGRRVAAGLYLCRLTAGATEEVFRVGIVR
jgi:hypothetical protein